MFARLGRFVVAHRRLVVFGWLVVVALGGILGGTVFGRLHTELHGHRNTESSRVSRELASLNTGGVRSAAVYALADGVAVDDPASRAGFQRITAAVRLRPDVELVADYYDLLADAPQDAANLVATDRRALSVYVQFKSTLAPGQEAPALEAVQRELAKLPAERVLFASDARNALDKVSGGDVLTSEIVAIPVAFVVMIFLFGGVLAAFLPLVIAGVAVAATLLALLAATYVTDVSSYALEVSTMFGLGLGIDYGLLVVSRFREERAAGYDSATAAERTVATSGVTVAFSGLTVAAALGGLFAFGDPILGSLALGGMAVVLIAMIAGVTLLPALLTMLGSHVKPAKLRADADSGYFYRLSRFVQRRAGVVALVTAAGLVVAALPFAGVKTAQSDERSLPRSSPARQFAEAQARFPNQQADPSLTVVAHVAATDAALTAYQRQLRAAPGVLNVFSNDITSNVAVLQVVVRGGSQTDDAQRLVRRARLIGTPFAKGVTGDSAFLVDEKAAQAARLPYAGLTIALATFILLFLMTGSLVIPVKAIVMNMLSLGATFGALVWGFQEGHLAGVLGFDAVGYLDRFVPLIIFIFAFGLSMDYEVFLLSRIRETWAETHDNDTAVAVGLQRSGRIITSAALLIVVVFAGFTTGKLLILKQMGFGMALAVIVDATVVRSLLVPATMKLMGRWNWWAPAPLRRLHDRIGLHEPVSAPVPEQAAAAAG